MREEWREGEVGASLMQRGRGGAGEWQGEVVEVSRWGSGLPFRAQVEAINTKVHDIYLCNCTVIDLEKRKGSI